MAADFALFKELGVPVWRGSFGWDDYEPTRGGADSSAWNDPPRREDDWGRFVGRVAAKLKRHRSILSYEIYNEENVPLWGWCGPT